jgi:hypothetical protein
VTAYDARPSLGSPLHVIRAFEVSPDFRRLASLFSGANATFLAWTSEDKLADSRRDRGVVEWDLGSRTQTWSQLTTGRVIGESWNIVRGSTADRWFLLRNWDAKILFFDRQPVAPTLPPIDCKDPRSLTVEIEAFINFDSHDPDEASANPLDLRLLPGGIVYGSEYPGQGTTWAFDPNTALFTIKGQNGALFSARLDTTPGATFIPNGTVRDEHGRDGVWQGLVSGYSGLSPTLEPAQVLEALANCARP